MTPKQKAEQIMLKYLKIENTFDINQLPYMALTKRCSLIAVDEILNEYIEQDKFPKSNTITEKINYWQEVRNVIYLL